MGSKNKTLVRRAENLFRFRDIDNIRRYHARIQKLILHQDCWNRDDLLVSTNLIEVVQVYEEEFNATRLIHLRDESKENSLGRDIINFKFLEKANFRARKKYSTKLRQLIKRVMFGLKAAGDLEAEGRLDRGARLFVDRVKKKYLQG